MFVERRTPSLILTRTSNLKIGIEPTTRIIFILAV